MRRNYAAGFGMLAGVVFSLLAMERPAIADPSLRLCTTEWPPFTVSEPGRPVAGVHTAAVTELFRRLGLEVRIDSIAWDRCWKETQSGTYDAVYSASFKPERAEIALYPKTPLQSLSYVALIRKGTAHGWDGKDAGTLPQPVASPQGYSVTADLKKSPTAKVDDGGQKDLQNLQKLLAGRVGSAVMEATVAKVLLAQLKAEDKVEILAPPVQAGKDYFIVVGRKHGGSLATAQALLDRIEPVLAALVQEGFVATLLAKE
jgi:polar amino acid transport system substrate-binding protein